MVVLAAAPGMELPTSGRGSRNTTRLRALCACACVSGGAENAGRAVWLVLISTRVRHTVTTDNFSRGFSHYLISGLISGGQEPEHRRSPVCSSHF